MKACAKCGIRKPLEDFHRNRVAGDGRASRCKACRNQTARELPLKTPEQRARQREANRRWRARNPEQVKNLQRESYARHREKRQIEARNRRVANPERHRAAARRWKQANRRRHLASLRKWREANAERHRAAVQQWFRNHPAQAREYAHRRRVLLGESTPATLARMAEILEQSCAYCGSMENITIDHILPLSRGGEHVPENLAPACGRCNSSKGAKTLDEWPGPHELAA